MKSILTLVLLSVFMAMPASAERMFVNKATFISAHATVDPALYVEPTSYQWQALTDSVWVIDPSSTALNIIVTGPKEKILKIRVAGTLGTTVGPFSDESMEFSIQSNADCNGDGIVGLIDFGCFAHKELSIANIGLFARFFGKKIVNGEYVNQ